MTHLGVQIQIRTAAGIIMAADSDQVHHMAQLSLLGADSVSLGREWHELLRTVDGLVVEVKPVTLPDPVEDEEEDQEPQRGEADCPASLPENEGGWLCELVRGHSGPHETSLVWGGASAR